MTDDPYRLYLVVRRGAFTTLEEGAVLGGAAAVRVLRELGDDPAFAEAIAAWRPRPGKVCLRARSPSQWQSVLESPHACAGDAVAALPPMRRSERPEVLEKIQAMSTELEPPPEDGEAPPGGVLYALNPAAAMSTGKTIAQVAHAAVMLSGDEAWVAAGCPGAVIAPSPARFAEIVASAGCAAKVVDAGLTEVPPGTVTVAAAQR